jgi:hypothetical protein
MATLRMRNCGVLDYRISKVWSGSYDRLTFTGLPSCCHKSILANKWLVIGKRRPTDFLLLKVAGTLRCAVARVGEDSIKRISFATENDTGVRLRPFFIPICSILGERGRGTFCFC